jgi:activating signal cointegrator complex subunit 2
MRSSTVPGAAKNTAKDKGKGKAPVPNDSSSSIPDPDIQMKVTQVLDILPEHPPEYIRALLEHPPLERDPEKVIEALLEGTAPAPEELEQSQSETASMIHGTVRLQVDGEDDAEKYVRERRNVFDDQVMDAAQLRVGKKRFLITFLLIY